MENTLLIMMIVGILIGSAIGGIVLLILAKYFGKVSNAKYGNSFFVCLIATSITYLIWYFIGFDVLNMGIVSIILLNFLILSILYIIIGKIVWKCSWIESIKANIIWVALYAAYLGYMLVQISS